jgi:hypothetical protein
MSNEDYGASRILADGTDVTLRIQYRQPRLPRGKTSYSTIGEIPGTDKAMK